MKSKNLLLTIVAAALLSATGFAQTWQHVGGAGFTGTAVTRTSLAIGKNDTPMVAFRDNGFADGKATVMKYANGAWNSMGNAGFSPHHIYEISIAVDSASGATYVAYVDSSVGITVAKFNGTSWGFIGAPGIVTNTQSDEVTIAIAGDGTPYISYRDGNSSYKASVKKYSGGSWTQVGSANFSAGTSEDVAMAIDHNGAPYVLSTLSSSDGIQVQKFNGSGWTTVGNIGFDTVSYATKGAIAIGPNNQLYVAITNKISPYKAHVWTFNGTSWVQVGQSITTSYAYDVHLAISNQGVPVMSFVDNTSNYKSSVVYYSGAAWHYLGNQAFSADAADYSSLAINSTGDVYLSYQDEGNANALTVDKLAHPTAIHNVSGLSEFKVYPNPSSGKFQISYNAAQTGEVQMSVTNLMGQTVWQNTTTGKGMETIDLSSAAKGLYVLQVRTMDGTESRMIEIK